MSFADFAKETMAFHCHGLCRQFEDSHGTLLMSHVFRLEDSAEAWQTITQTIGLPGIELPHHNPTLLLDGRPRNDYRDDYTPAIRDAVAKHFATDIERGEYSF